MLLRNNNSHIVDPINWWASLGLELKMPEAHRIDLKKTLAKISIASRRFSTNRGLRRLEKRIQTDLYCGELNEVDIAETKVDEDLKNQKVKILLSHSHEYKFKSREKYSKILAAFISDEGIPEYLAVFAKKANSGEIEIFMTEDLFNKMPPETLNSLIRDIVDQKDKGFLNLECPEYLNKLIESDIEYLKQTVRRELEFLDQHKAELESKGFKDLRPMWRVGLFGESVDRVFFFRASDSQDNQVVIKIDEYEDMSSIGEVFIREGIKSHPNVMHVYEVSSLKNGDEYVVLSYMDGESLREFMCAKQQLSVLEILDIMLQIAEGIKHLHSYGIPHGDLNAVNICINEGKKIGIIDPFHIFPEKYDENGRHKNFERESRADLDSLATVVLGLISCELFWGLIGKECSLSPPEAYKEMIRNKIRATLDTSSATKDMDPQDYRALSILFFKLMNNGYAIWDPGRWDEFIEGFAGDVYNNIEEVLGDLKSLKQSLIG